MNMGRTNGSMNKSVICTQSKQQVLVPILVCVCHLYQYFLYVLVSGFHCTKFLCSILNCWQSCRIIFPFRFAPLSVMNSPSTSYWHVMSSPRTSDKLLFSPLHQMGIHCSWYMPWYHGTMAFYWLRLQHSCILQCTCNRLERHRLLCAIATYHLFLITSPC